MILLSVWVGTPVLLRWKLPASSSAVSQRASCTWRSRYSTNSPDTSLAAVSVYWILHGNNVRGGGRNSHRHGTAQDVG